MAHFTGLQVSYEPGQWAVWGGVILMGFGLVVVFYFVHARVWAIPVRNARGELVLWVGGMANKNKDAFEHRFKKVVEDIQSEIAKSDVGQLKSSAERESSAHFPGTLAARR